MWRDINAVLSIDTPLSVPGAKLLKCVNFEPTVLMSSGTSTSLTLKTTGFVSARSFICVKAREAG